MKKVLLLINRLSENPTEDELDVIVQAEAVEKALDALGISHQRADFSLDLEHVRKIIENVRPDMAFNLVETVEGKGSLIHLPPSLLEALKVPCTGSGSYAMLVTTDKVRTKKVLKEAGLPTPDWFRPGNDNKPDPKKSYILKPVWEDGSAGITDESVVDGKTFDYESFSKEGRFREFFLEEYIDGREFNITMLAGLQGAEVMPAAEMQYIDYPDHKPRILNFASKWDSGSFEYAKTVRTFDLPVQDEKLVNKMKENSLQCWKLFEMRGYARVDFRVDKRNNPFILEVNTNPCISPDAGFVAACAEGGVNYTTMIERILMDAK